MTFSSGSRFRTVFCLLVGLSLVACSTPADSGGGSGGSDEGAGGKTGSGGAKGGSGGRSGGSGGGGKGDGGSGDGGSSAGGKGAGGSGEGGSSAGGSGQGGSAAGGASSGGDNGSDAGSGGQGTDGPGAGGSGGELPKFSFFVTSLEAMLRLAKKQSPTALMGFGGDLRYGEKDGLAGADKICTEIAESALAGAGAKQWRAFLSVTKGPAGTPIDAADRIGAGPWYDRLGRLVAMTKADLLQNRPNSPDAKLKEDLPNETGTLNHRPDPTKPVADNHHTLTGSNAQGKLYGPKSTCLDWTTNARDNVMTGRPRIGFSWSIANRTNWISGQDEGGCGAGVAVQPNGGSDPSNPIVGSGGGYGGIYCFALTP